MELANVEQPVTPGAAETAAAGAEDPQLSTISRRPRTSRLRRTTSLEDESALEGEPAPIVTARLPRQRPEPPAAASLAVASPAVAPTAVPKVAAVAPPRPARATSAPDPVGPGPIAELPQPFYDPSGEPRRETLTPEEYQALLERGALVDDTMPPRRRALLRLLRR